MTITTFTIENEMIIKRSFCIPSNQIKSNHIITRSKTARERTATPTCVLIPVSPLVRTYPCTILLPRILSIFLWKVHAMRIHKNHLHVRFFFFGGGTRRIFRVCESKNKKKGRKGLPFSHTYGGIFTILIGRINSPCHSRTHHTT